MPRRTKRTGRPPVLLDTDVRHRLLEYVEKGNHLKTACALVGVHPATLYRWLDRADEADEAALNDQPIDDVQRVYREFRDALALARARAQKLAVETVNRAMKGGDIISERPLVGLDGEALRDDSGRILYERTYTQPDGRLAMTYLARTAPDMWGQNAVQRVELTGAAGGAVQVELTHVEGLAQRIAAVAAERRADRELEAAEAAEAEDEYEDAEVVGEG